MNKNQKKNSPLSKYFKYINLCFQMLSIIILFYFIGKVVSNQFERSKIILGIFILVGVVVSTVYVIRDIIKH